MGGVLHDFSNPSIYGNGYFYFPNKENSDVSFTLGAPQLEKLNLESTQISDYSALPSLPHLHSLNLAHCPAPSEQALGVLGACCGLEVLVLSGVAVEGKSLAGLAGVVKGHQYRKHCYWCSILQVSLLPLSSYLIGTCALMLPWKL